MAERIVCAMSGGVDSSAAAYLLKEQGYDVVGIAMKLWNYSPQRVGTGCCTPEDMADARRVAAKLDIPFYVIDWREQMQREVIDRFVGEYLGGRTPNPCVYCNDTIKFLLLLKEAERLGAQRIATGHYARLERAGDDVRLYKGGDPVKDQTYFLFNLKREQLARAVFPVGGMPKMEVRALAERAGLPVATKQESQEICFVEDGDYVSILERNKPNHPALQPGEFVDAEGVVVGEHRGYARYTIGQRRGLNLGGGPPRYVLRIEPQTRRVVVGGREELAAHGLIARPINDLGLAVAGEAQRAAVRIRHTGTEMPCTVTHDGTAARVVFDDPLDAVTPGQAAVLYDGERVLGGGWIERSLSMKEVEAPQEAHAVGQ